jgi:hypothetical protein
MIRQRLRGLIGTTIMTCIPWTAFGFLCGLVFHFRLIPHLMLFAAPGVPGGTVGALTIAGAAVGIINGLVFSALVFAGERGKSVDELSGWRFAAWGGLATAGVLGVMLTSPIAAAIGAVLGAGAAVSALATARRARVAREAAPSLSA